MTDKNKGEENSVQSKKSLQEKKDDPDKLIAESVDEFPQLRSNAISNGGDREPVQA